MTGQTTIAAFIVLLAIIETVEVFISVGRSIASPNLHQFSQNKLNQLMVSMVGLHSLLFYFWKPDE
jgi:hypothetical protein